MDRDTTHELRLLKQALNRSAQFAIDNALNNAKPEEFKVTLLTGKRALQGLLQHTSSFLLQGRPMTEEARLELLVKMMSAAQALQHAEITEHMLRQESIFLQKALKYSSAVKCLNYFWLSDKDFRETIKRACLVSMPAEAAQHAVAFIDEIVHDRMRMPSIATLSRVTARLDTAWMLYFREHILMPKLMVFHGKGFGFLCKPMPPGRHGKDTR